MKQNRYFTAEQQPLALLMRQEMKYSYQKIALKSNMSKTSVQRIVKKLIVQGRVCQSRNLIVVDVNHCWKETSKSLKEQSHNSEKRLKLLQ